MVKQRDGVLAMIAGRGAELVEDRLLGTGCRQRIARADGTDVLAASCSVHRGLRGDRMGGTAR
jgi:hypothetical protein